MIKRANYVIIAGGLIVAAALMVSTVDEMTLGVGGLFLWAATPYVVAIISNHKFRSSHLAAKAILIGVLFVALGGNFLILDAFYIHTDAQAGLLFLFLPPVQCAVFMGVSGLATLVLKQRGIAEPPYRGGRG